jgi:ATP-dependent Lon protease
MDGVLIFPGMISPILLNDDSSRQLVDDIMRGEKRFVLLHPLPRGPEMLEVPGFSALKSGGIPGLFNTGTLCHVLRVLRIPDGSVRILVHGVSRVKVRESGPDGPYLIAVVKAVDDVETTGEDEELNALQKLTVENVNRAIALNAMPDELAVAAINSEGPGKLADLIATNLSVRTFDLLPLLEERNTKKRLRRLQDILGREVRMLEISHRINEQVRDEVDKNQRVYYLGQQIKALRRELGEIDSHDSELEDLAVRLAKSTMPAHARKVADRELGRLQNLPPAAAEYGVIRTYFEWILDIPWSTSSDDRINIAKAEGILDEDHFGLEKVKERILEFLSVIRLKSGDLKGPILCFVGPPGVGKTSLGRSIARATGRKFQNFSLGGMRDEAEIRGHRRTYIGAMPGRIIKALKESGTNNPLIMLDEIDKLGSDFRGDPASALLEVLDPEQNSHFTDHYMDMPIDLSKVMFITTANTIDAIPEALRDRMEIIRIAGYTDMEKEEIAARYLVPREMENNGLQKKHIQFARPALKALVRDYTSEAGVRNLQLQVAKVCRKVARVVADFESAAEVENSKAPSAPERARVGPKDLEKYLGPKLSFMEAAERLDRPGVAVGLAWTSVGGAILFIEAARYRGKGEIKLTGQLGDVMKESALAALTYLRANSSQFSLTEEDFEKFDYHLHVPAGATPKDGPSAGTAIATAICSLMTQRPVRDFVAMTGEITLRGNVMPVGGIKEKCLAALRAGVKDVYLPHHNEGDYSEVPEQIRKGLRVQFFREASEFIQSALR